MSANRATDLELTNSGHKNKAMERALPAGLALATSGPLRYNPGRLSRSAQ
jgi:hypothetical protein